MLYIKKTEKELLIRIFKDINSLTKYDIDFYQSNLDEYIYTFIKEEQLRIKVNDTILKLVDMKFSKRLNEISPNNKNGIIPI